MVHVFQFDIQETQTEPVPPGPNVTSDVPDLRTLPQSWQSAKRSFWMDLFTSMEKFSNSGLTVLRRVTVLSEA